MFNVGDVIRNRYRINSILFQSKLSNIYLVEDRHLKGNLWVVKEMKFLAMDSFERQKIITQFEVEVKKMSELSHVNLAKVIDFFVEGQNLYVLREYVPGFEVYAIMKNSSGMLSEKDVLSWGIQLADLFKYLFDRKFPAVFFRDLSLRNIIVSPDGIIKVVDLGLSMVFQTESDPNKLKSLGAMDYTSPEQFDESYEFSQGALIYCLGAIMFHMLTRENPAHSMFNLPPVENLNPAVSSTTRQIISKATAISIDRRFSGLSDLKKALQAVLKGLTMENRKTMTINLKNHIENMDSNTRELVFPTEEKKKSGFGTLVATVITALIAGIAYLVYRLFF